MKRLHSFYLSSYRFIGFIFLIGLISSILWYGFSVLFFIASSSWSTPFILSPNQENVLAHQEHLLNVQQELLKNTAELAAAKNDLSNKEIVLKNAEELLSRFEKSIEKQVRQDTQNGDIYHALTQEKESSVVELTKLASAIKLKEATIHKELKIALITKEEALAQQLTLSNLHFALIEAKARMHEFEQRASDLNAAALTFNGASTSLAAMDKIVKQIELARQIAQLKSDIYSLKITIEHLTQVTKKRAEVLALMKQSPYILATKEPTHVAFVPYKNLSKVKKGAAVYSCYFDMLLCYHSGHITEIYKAEEYAKHPMFSSDMKGQFVGIAFNDEMDAQKKLLFLGSKPLLL